MAKGLGFADQFAGVSPVNPDGNPNLGPRRSGPNWLTMAHRRRAAFKYGNASSRQYFSGGPGGYTLEGASPFEREVQAKLIKVRDK